MSIRINSLNINEVLQHPWLADDPDIISRVERILTPTLLLSRGSKRAIENDSMSMDADIGSANVDELVSNGQAKRRKY